jgi:hypothetical protein
VPEPVQRDLVTRSRDLANESGMPRRLLAAHEEHRRRKGALERS